MPLNSTDFYKKAPPEKGASSFIYPPTPGNIAFFVEALQAGCVVAIPTETVYGLSGLALDEKACHSIFSIKGRPLVDPLIVHVNNPEMAAQLAELPPAFTALAEAFWPGPLTLILKKRPIVPDLVTAGKPTVAIRMPRHPVALELLQGLQAPLAAPSANPFGYVSPVRAEHVADSFGETVPFILDGGPCDIGLESTILDLTDDSAPKVLRPGAVSPDQISKVLGKPVPLLNVNLHHEDSATAPGTFSRHYSPDKELLLFEEGSNPSPSPDDALVYLQRPTGDSPSSVFWLSEKGDAESVAQSLFSLLRQLDRQDFSRILWELPAATRSGLWLAIRDRMKRAAANK
ncbi:MAG: L-threonylcarbamoyladenylate synthase [Puniceicoccaceae bacterium]